MAARQSGDEKQPRQVRKTVTLDADKLERLRKVLRARSDAEALRVAVEHLLMHFEGHSEEE